jgi:hypothetical protein
VLEALVPDVFLLSIEEGKRQDGARSIRVAWSLLL